MEKKDTKQTLPLIPVRDVVIFPHAQVPISLKREKSVKALEKALSGDKTLFLVMQKIKEIDDPTTNDLFGVGTIAKITSVQRMPDGVINIVVEGNTTAKTIRHTRTDPYFETEVSPTPEPEYSKEELESVIRPIVEHFRQAISLGKMVPLDLIPSIFDLTNPYQTMDMIIFNLDLKPIEKQALLEAPDFKARAKLLTIHLAKEISILQTARKIND